MLRDPNRPRGNPLFDDIDPTVPSFGDHAAEFPAPVGPSATARPRPHHPLFDDRADRDDAPGGESRRETGREEPASGRSEEGPDGPFTASGLLDALADAGPEAAAHLIRAMEELLLAARTVLSAAERGVDGTRGRSTRPGAGSGSERVRRIDVD